MKKTKDRVMATVTALGLIVALIGAASMDSESIVIPVIMLFGGLTLTGLISRVYWHFI